MAREFLGDEWPDQRHHHGSESVYKHWTGWVFYTEGVRHMATDLGAFWLIDLIASHQKPIGKMPKLAGFQLWILKCDPDEVATASCHADIDEPAEVSQQIEYTDFPYRQQKLYLVDRVLMLPTEY